jgi:hypothetical protein
MPHFFLKLIGPRPSFAQDMNEQEKSMMHEHVLYWKGRQDKGEVLVFGPVLDPKGPMAWELSWQRTKRRRALSWRVIRR